MRCGLPRRASDFLESRNLLDFTSCLAVLTLPFRGSNKFRRCIYRQTSNRHGTTRDEAGFSDPRSSRLGSPAPQSQPPRLVIRIRVCFLPAGSNLVAQDAGRMGTLSPSPVCVCREIQVGLTFGVLVQQALRVVDTGPASRFISLEGPTPSCFSAGLVCENEGRARFHRIKPAFGESYSAIYLVRYVCIYHIAAQIPKSSGSLVEATLERSLGPWWPWCSPQPAVPRGI